MREKEAEVTQIFSDGNPLNIPCMGTLSGIGHPPLFARPSGGGNLIDHLQGAGTAEPPPVRYGVMDRSINSGVPFQKGGGAVFRRLVGPVINEPSGRFTERESYAARNSADVTKSHITSEDAGRRFASCRAAAAVASLKR